jgi:hypothetical protein
LKKIFDGKVYDTDNSKILCNISPRQYRYVGRSDFRWDETYLYRTKNGRFFIAGEGGPLSQWGTPEGNHGFTSGSGLKPIQEIEARRLTEEFADTETYVSVFGEPEAA